MLHHAHSSFGQDTVVITQLPRFTISGYVKDLSTVSVSALKSTATLENLIHNRINVRWSPTGSVVLAGELRNRLFVGTSVADQHYAEYITRSEEHMTLGISVKKRNALLHSTFDRLYIDWSNKDWQVRFGKQRINWSKSYVWNPNDLFNAYSFIDFDYEERKGTDALLIKRNLPQSTVELSGSFAKSFDETIIAAKFSHNHKEYDLQYIIGKYKNDIVIGTGWAGQIGSAGLKGEVSYFHPFHSGRSTKTITGSVSFDYTFPGTLAYRFEALYTSAPAIQTKEFMFQSVTAKAVSFDRLSFFNAIKYDVSPLVQLNTNTIWYSMSKSLFLNPGINFSLSSDTDLLLAAQYFCATTSSFRSTSLFARLKWSF